MKIFMVAGWNEKLWRDAGLKKSMLDPPKRFVLCTAATGRYSSKGTRFFSLIGPFELVRAPTI